MDKQVGRRRPEPRDDHQIARDPLTVRGAGSADRDLLDVAAARGREDRGAGDDPALPPTIPPTGRRSTTVTSTPAPSKRACVHVPRLARGEDDGSPTRPNPEAIDEQLDRRPHHHAREIVVREHRRLLHGARGEHEVPGPDPVQDVGTRRRDERPVEDAEGRRARQHLRSGLFGLAQEVGTRIRIGEPAQMPARLVRLVEHDDLRTRRRRTPGGRQAGGAGSDHEDVHVEVHTLPEPMVLLERNLPQPCLRADERLHEPPRPPGVLEHLVVEARRHHEREGVEPAVDVAVDGRPGVLPVHGHPVTNGLGARRGRSGRRRSASGSSGRTPSCTGARGVGDT